MKTRIFILTAILLWASYIFSQDEIGLPKLTPEKGYWSIGYYGSGSLGLSNAYIGNPVQPGFGGMLEISYKDSKSKVILIAGENRISSGGSGHSEVAEFSVGPRFGSRGGSNNFAELTAGALIIRQVYEIYTITYQHSYYPAFKTEPEIGIAATAGLGKEIKLDGSTSLILKLRLITAYPIKDELFAFLSAGTGIIFSSKQPKGTTRKSSAIGLGLAFMYGRNNPGMLSKADYDWGTNYGLGLSIRVSPKIELTIDYNSNTLAGINPFINYAESCTNINLGGRFFINRSRLTSFFECGGGTYSHKIYASSNGVTAEVIDERNIYPGFNVGTGMKLNLIHYADLIARGNLHFLFTGKHDDAPGYLSIQGGIRFNL